MTVADSLQRSHIYSDDRRASGVPRICSPPPLSPTGAADLADLADLDRHTVIAGTVVRGERLASPTRGHNPLPQDVLIAFLAFAAQVSPAGYWSCSQSQRQGRLWVMLER